MQYTPSPEQQMESANQFIAILAHELRNPLAPIIHEIEALKLRGITDPEAQRAIDVIERQAKQIAHLLKDLLDVSRAMRGKIQLQLAPTDLRTVMHHAVETAMPLIRKGNHTLTVDVPQEPIICIGDPVRLEQIIVNLLNNAAKYSDPHGTIHLSLTRNEDEAVVTVRDWGVGIPPEFLPKIFDLFRQADQSLARVKGGLGVGLGLSRILTQLHGGTITAASEGTGTGSTFTLRFPVKNMSADELPKPATPTAPAPHTILIVEDDPVLAESLARLLRQLGQEVYTSYSGADALTIAPVYSPDVIFVDIAMPGMSGFECAQAIRKDPLLKSTALIALTGFGEESFRQRSREAGFNDHLVKPVGMHELIDILNRYPPKQT